MDLFDEARDAIDHLQDDELPLDVTELCHYYRIASTLSFGDKAARALERQLRELLIVRLNERPEGPTGTGGNIGYMATAPSRKLGTAAKAMSQT